MQDPFLNSDKMQDFFQFNSDKLQYFVKFRQNASFVKFRQNAGLFIIQTKFTNLKSTKGKTVSYFLSPQQDR